MNVFYIEDCLNLLVSENIYSPSFRLDKKDVTFLNSINSQLNKGMALTERQYNALVEKCNEYAEFFDAQGVDLDASTQKVRFPFREIDRRKEITLEYVEEFNNEAIRIRFPFSKKQIIAVQAIKEKVPHLQYLHRKGSHEHFISVTPRNLFNFYKGYNFPGFTVQDEVQELLDFVKDINDNAQDYVPGVYNYELKNLRENANACILDKLGTPCNENLYKYYDRKALYGLTHFNQDDLDESFKNCSDFTQKITHRKFPGVWNKTNHTNLKPVLHSFNELDRYPLFIHLTDQKEYEQLIHTHEILKDYVDAESISVMFRLDNTHEDNINFNEYIKNNKLNNPLAKNTKIVYTNSKISKPTLESKILPEAWLTFSDERIPQELSKYMMQCDLIVYDVETMSSFTIFGYKQYDII